MSYCYKEKNDTLFHYSYFNSDHWVPIAQSGLAHFIREIYPKISTAIDNLFECEKNYLPFNDEDIEQVKWLLDELRLCLLLPDKIKEYNSLHFEKNNFELMYTVPKIIEIIDSLKRFLNEIRKC